MQRVKPKEFNYIQNINTYNEPYEVNYIPNGNCSQNIEKNFYMNNETSTYRANKFLSIPERQKIIRQINETHRKQEIILSKKKEKSQNLLYVKKTKSDLSLVDKNSIKKNNFTRNKNKVTGFKNIKFTENKNLINKTIKEYYQKIGSPFKTYLKTLNYDYKENKNFNNNNKNVNNIVNNNANNDIYKKPISGKVFNKASQNLGEEEEDKDNIDQLIITNTARKEKINCTKMIKNNGIRKNIFNIIDNYNTKTIRNKNDNNLNVNFNKKNKTNEFLQKNNSSSNFKLKNNNTILSKNIKGIQSKEYLLYDKAEPYTKNIIDEIDIKNNSCKNNKSINIIKSVYLEDETDKIIPINDDYYMMGNYNYNNFGTYKMNNNIYSVNKNQSNIKYKKKNVKSPGIGVLPKRRIFRSNFMSNDLPKVIIENDVISFENSNFETYNNGKEKMKYNYLSPEAENRHDINRNYFYEKEYNMNFENDNYLDNNDKRFINTEIKNKRLFLTLKDISPKEKRRSKSFSYTNENDDNNNIYQNGKNNYKYQNGKNNSPLYKEKYIPNKSLITKEVIFNFAVNKNNSSCYNSDDDIMNSNYGSSHNSSANLKGNNNSFDNRLKNVLNNNFHLAYNNSNNNIFVSNEAKSPTKDYFFNYLSNKINNDYLNENKMSKFEKKLYNSEFYNKNLYCERCKRNYCPYCCRENDTLIHVNKRITPLKYIKNNYYPRTIHSKSMSVNFENNDLKNNLIGKNIERYNEEKSIIKKELINNADLKLDISNGKHSTGQNLNNNLAEGGSFNSNTNIIENTESRENIENKMMKNDLYKYEQDDISKTEVDTNLNEVKNESKNNKDENKIKNNKDSEIDKTEQTNILSEITSNAINFSNNDDIILNENKNNENSNKKNNNQIKIYDEKSNEKINDFQNLPTNRSFSIKDNSINKSYRNNNTKIDIETNNNSNKNKIVKSLIIKDDLTKKDYINKRNQFQTPLLSDILEYINIISVKNYCKIKNNIINIIINSEKNIELLFIKILYPIAINQKKYQPIYAKLCKDIDKYFNKKDREKDKAKSVIRNQLMKFCKSNFKKIKVRLNNIVNIVNDINFIGELINVQMVSKKVGPQCLTHLVNKFNQYNTNNNLFSKKAEKYLYLDCIINLLNKFGTCINCYQKDKIRQDELLLFETEINKNINILEDIKKDKANNDMPIMTKINLEQLLNKSKNNWEFTLYEKYRNQLLKNIYNQPKNNINEIKIEVKNHKKQNKSVSPYSNRNLDNNNNSNSNDVKLKNTSDDDEINFYYL